MKNGIDDKGRILKRLRHGFKITEEELLTLMSSGKTVFEYAIEMERVINCDSFTNPKSVNIILSKKRYDLLERVALKTLLKVNRKNLSKRYIETILELFLAGEKINISCFSPFKKGNDLNDAAELYITYARYKLEDYLPSLSKETLLSKDLNSSDNTNRNVIDRFFKSGFRERTFLQILLSKANKKTIGRFIDANLSKDIDIALILRSYSINTGGIDYELKPIDFTNQIVEDDNNELERISLTKEQLLLLKMLHNAFINNSDPKAVRALLNSYRIQFKKKNPNTIREIYKLISLAKKGLRIVIGDKSNYSNSQKKVSVRMPITGLINHEMGHALFYSIPDRTIPNEFWTIVNNIKANPDTLRKIDEYSKRATERKLRIQTLADNIYDVSFPEMSKVIKYYKLQGINKNRRLFGKKSIKTEELEELERETLPLREEIREYLEKTKEEKMKLYTEKGYSEKDLEVLFKDSFTVKEYARMHKRIQKREYELALYRTILSPQGSIGDIIDAVYEGQFFGGKLKHDSKDIKPYSGHGLYYYCHSSENIFSEIIANYKTLMMSEESDRYLRELRDILGDEFVDFLDNYYNNIILGQVFDESFLLENRLS